MTASLSSHMYEEKLYIFKDNKICEIIHIKIIKDNRKIYM